MLIGNAQVYNAGWLDIVFNKRNKTYGAYVLRRESAATLTKAFFITAPLFVLLFVAPLIYNKLNPVIVVKEDTIVTLTPMPDVQPLQKEKKIEPMPQEAAPKKVKTVQFAGAPKVVETAVEINIPKITDMADAVIGPITQDGEAVEGNVVVVGAGGTGAAETPAGNGNEIVEAAVVQKYPEFTGGMDAWRKFIQKNLRYPAAAQEAGTQGKVFISFVVEKDGSITDVTVLKGIGSGCDEEAIRVIKKSPRWSPGFQNNSPVRVRYNMPIGFALN